MKEIFFKNIYRTIALLSMSFLCVSCVGAGTLTRIPHVWDIKDQGNLGLCPISYNRMIVGCPRTPVFNTTNVQEITPIKLIGMWPTPQSDELLNGVREIKYKRDLAWRGIVAFVIIPIPLLIPSGYNEAKFSFQNEHLVHVEYTENHLDAAICGLHSEGPNGFGCISDWH